MCTNTQNCIWFPPHTTILDFYWECKLGRLLTFTVLAMVVAPYRKDHHRHHQRFYDRDERCSKIPRLNLLERNSSVSWGNEMRKDLQLGKVRSLRLQSLHSKVNSKWNLGIFLIFRARKQMEKQHDFYSLERLTRHIVTAQWHTIDPAVLDQSFPTDFYKEPAILAREHMSILFISMASAVQY